MRIHLYALAASALLLCRVQAAHGMSTIGVNVRDAGSGERIPARCCVMDSLGQSRYPDIFENIYNTFGDGYFYFDGDFELAVAEGPVIIRISKGPEYYPFIDTIRVRTDTTVTIDLERMIDMRQAGWYGGDVHVHIEHGGVHDLVPADAHFVGRAEDLQFVNCLDNTVHFTGAPDTVSTDDCVVYMSEELRNFVYGHCALPGLRSLILPSEPVWDKMIGDLADSVHAQNGPIVICAHPLTTYDFDYIDDWPGTGLAREVPVDIISGKVDAFEVLSYSNIAVGGIALDLWYEILNCGFRLPPCAGSDATVDRLRSPPMGGFRTYVMHEGGAPGIYDWLEGLASGRSFVTNGPLFTEFGVLGYFGMGDSLSLYRGTYLPYLDVAVRCAFPLDRVEIVMNGRVVDTLLPGMDPRVIEGRSEFYIHESCWVAARAYGEAVAWVMQGDGMFAHTGPFYFDMEGEHIRRRESAEFLGSWVESLVALVKEDGVWLNQEDSIRVLSRFESAAAWYRELMDVATGTEEPTGGTAPDPLTVEAFPNPFSTATEIRIAGSGAGTVKAIESRLMSNVPAAEPARVAIFDVAGRLVRRLDPVPGAGFSSVTWDGKNGEGVLAASGIYFCRVSVGSMQTSTKILLMR